MVHRASIGSAPCSIGWGVTARRAIHPSVNASQIMEPLHCIYRTYGRPPRTSPIVIPDAYGDHGKRLQETLSGDINND